MKPFLSMLLLVALALGLCGFQRGLQVIVSPNAAAAITLDGAVHCSNTVRGDGTAATTLACTLTSVTAGDLITCAVGSGGHGIIKVADSTNGTYKNAAYFPEGTVGDAVLISFFPNAASGTYSPTATFTVSENFLSIDCQAWKNARTTLVSDPAVNLYKTATSTNPNGGTAQTPTGNGELLNGYVFFANSANPTAGTNYTIIDGPGSTAWPGVPPAYDEYWIQTTATSTNCPYTQASNTWDALCVAFLPASAPAGQDTPYPSSFTDFENSTDGTNATATILNAGTHGTGGTWSGTANAQTKVATAAQKSLHSPVIVAGTSFTDSGSTRGLKVDYTIKNSTAMNYTFNAPFPDASIGFFFNTTIPTSSITFYPTVAINSSDDNADLMVSNSLMYLETVGNPNGAPDSCTGCSTVGTQTGYAYAINTWYWVTISFHQTGSHCMSIYETSTWTQAATMCKASTAATPAFRVGIGTGDNGTLGFYYVDNLEIDHLSGHFPVLP